MESWADQQGVCVLGAAGMAWDQGGGRENFRGVGGRWVGGCVGGG